MIPWRPRLTIWELKRILNPVYRVMFLLGVKWSTLPTFNLRVSVPENQWMKEDNLESSLMWNNFPLGSYIHVPRRLLTLDPMSEAARKRMTFIIKVRACAAQEGFFIIFCKFIHHDIFLILQCFNINILSLLLCLLSTSVYIINTR